MSFDMDTMAGCIGVTAARVREDLARCGIRHGEWVMLHSPLKRIGHVDGGADAVVRVTGVPTGCRGFYGTRPTHVSEFVESADLVVHGRVGEAAMILVESRRLADLVIGRLVAEPDFLLCWRPDCAFCTGGRRRIDAQPKAILERGARLAAWGLYRPEGGGA